MSAPSMFLHPLGTVVKYGKTLTGLLNKAKDKDKDKDKDEASSVQTKIEIYEKVEEATMELVGEFRGEQGRMALFPEECLGKLLNKIGVNLAEFAKADPDNKSIYENLACKVHDLIKPAGMKRESSSSTTSSVGNVADLGYSLELSTVNDIQGKEIEAAYKGLSLKEKCYLSFFTLFPADAIVSKRDIIHCWVGIDIDMAGDDMLSKLIAVGVIERVIGNRRILSGYRMGIGVRKALEEEDPVVVPRCYQAKNSPWCMVYAESINPDFEFPYPGRQLGDVLAILNIKQSTLNPNNFESLRKMKNLEVLYYGTWKNNSEKYVMVKEAFFEALQHLKQLRFLSLQGVSGIAKLPKSLYMLHNLMVLDLRACHNLGVIDAQGIVSLKKLTHLDLSQCYLLDHIPKAITALTQLQVLKGFIINNPLPQTRKQDKGRNPENAASPCAFTDLSKLMQLVKLTVRTRRLDFPTAQDVGTLCQLPQLTTLRVTWVGSSNDCQTHGGMGNLFPKKLLKLELQAAPEGTVSRLLALISTAGRDNSLKKLYIKGGGLSNLCTQEHQLLNVKVLRLRYLPYLHIHWAQFKKSFPGLRRLEVFGCPNLVFFPCDQNGIWESTN